MGRRGPKPLKAEAISQSALALFVERGVKGATTREIAKRARTTEGSLYRYFAGKEDLARCVLTKSLVHFGESIAKSLDGVAGARLRLRRFVVSYLRYASEYPLEHAFVCQTHTQKLIGAPDEILRPRRILIDILSDGVSSGDFLEADPRQLAPFITGGLSRVGLALPGPENAIEVDAVIDTYCDVVDRMVCGLTKENVLESSQS